MGTGGSGVKPMPSEHSKIMTNKCIDCHYYTGKAKADNTPSEKGGHTFIINDKLCLQCHEEPTKLVEKWKPIIDPLAKQLKDLLDSYPDKRSRVYLDAKKNYGMATGDKGMGIDGIHNPQYAEILLKYSISALTSGASWKEQK